MAVALVVAATALLRIHLLQTPLERDEGEYAYVGQLMLQGIPPYKLASNMKLPGTYAVYALIMAAFGQTIGGIHLGLLLVNAASIVLVYLLGKKLFSVSAGLAACAAFALLSVSAGVLGTQAHATHFVVLAALGGVWLLLRFDRASTLFASGMLFGTAFVVIQHGVFFGMFAAVYLAVRRQWRKLPLFLAGCVAPFAITCLVLWSAGVFGSFWFWTFTYARSYVSESSLREGAEALATNFGPILRQNAALWALAAAGLALTLRARRYFVPALLLFSFVAVCPGFFFRAHYFVVMLPAAALLAGACVRDRLSAGVFAAALLVSLFTQRDVLFRMSPAEVSRELYGVEPFPEAIPVADYIRAHTRPEDRIAVLASEPEIYFYARRHSATSLLYVEPLVESQPYALRMQDEMIAELERNQPAYLVRFPIIETLSLGADEPAKIFQWWTERGAQHYRLTGIADILENGSSVYRWDEAAETYQPRSLYHLAVYRRQ
jgi:hypothetical protein